VGLRDVRTPADDAVPVSADVPAKGIGYKIEKNQRRVEDPESTLNIQLKAPFWMIPLFETVAKANPAEERAATKIVEKRMSIVVFSNSFLLVGYVAWLYRYKGIGKFFG
jgi:hypothetical protein